MLLMLLFRQGLIMHSRAQYILWTFSPSQALGVHGRRCMPIGKSLHAENVSLRAEGMACRRGKLPEGANRPENAAQSAAL
jgi:hypothetical protein